jgi:hypothetical protein
LFATTGFTLAGVSYPACNVTYHHSCVGVGTPFRSRYRDSTRGLFFPKTLVGYPFVCELCTVRANVGVPPPPSGTMNALMMLERMRMIDTAHSWAPKTLVGYQGNLRRFHRFLDQFQICGPHLRNLPTVPPHGDAILLLWSMEHYTLQESSHRTQEFVGYTGARSLRSALGSVSAWTLSLGQAGSAYRTQNQLFGPDGVASTDDLLTRMTLAGMSRRLGTESRPPTAIRAEHVRWNLDYRTRLLSHPSTPLEYQYDLLLANLAELFFWLGWLRASEGFSLRWCDLEYISPAQAASHALPPLTGALLLKLLESTKSHQTEQVDVILAARTASGFRPGSTYLAALAQRPASALPTDPVFTSRSGKVWDSHYFRHTHLYPLLEQQRREGDPYLLPFDGSTPTRLIPLLYYSMGCYRRGANSHVQRHRPGCVRKADPGEVINHGRWRSKNRGSEPMPVHYHEPTLEDLLYITLLCM